MAAWIPLLGAGISALGGVIGSWFGKKSTDNSNKANLELAKYQAQQNQLMLDRAYNQNLHMWNETNAYNSPVAQMARLKSAGLNPNLVYGTGSVTGNTTSSAPQLEAASYDAPNIRPYTGWNLGLTDAVATYNQMKLQDAQIDQLKANTALTTQQIITEGKKGSNLGINTELGKYNLRMMQQLEETNLSQAKANLEKTRSDTSLNSIRSQLMKADLDMRPYQIEKLANEIEGIKTENELKNFELTMGAKYGLSRNSPEWLRILAIVASRLFPNFGFDKVGEFGKSMIDNIFNPR